VWAVDLLSSRSWSVEVSPCGPTKPGYPQVDSGMPSDDVGIGIGALERRRNFAVSDRSAMRSALRLFLGEVTTFAAVIETTICWSRDTAPPRRAGAGGRRPDVPTPDARVGVADQARGWTGGAMLPPLRPPPSRSRTCSGDLASEQEQTPASLRSHSISPCGML